MKTQIRALFPIAIVASLVASPVGALVLSAGPAGLDPAPRGEPDRLWLACGPEFLALVGPGGSPCIAEAENGDTVEIIGYGTFSAATEQASGGGTLVHRDSSGNIVGQTAFTVTGKSQFESFGTDPSMTFLEGGVLVLDVHLEIAELDGFLEVWCLVGSPPEFAFEGIRLVVFDANEEIVIDFNAAVQGATVFVQV